jgi:hypothetical protein
MPDMERTNIIFKGALMGLIGIVYPHDPLQGRGLLIYQGLFFAGQIIPACGILKM